MLVAAQAVAASPAEKQSSVLLGRDYRSLVILLGITYSQCSEMCSRTRAQGKLVPQLKHTRLT